jgi:hypothetical protein
MVQLTWGVLGPNVIYIHTEGMGKILKNIFETNYYRWYCNSSDNFSYFIQRYVLNDKTYEKLSWKKDW